jgi:hypothetical protein
VDATVPDALVEEGGAHVEDCDPPVDRIDKTELNVNVEVADMGVVTTAIAKLNRRGSSLTGHGEGRAHPAAAMRDVRQDLAIGRALTALGRRLEADACEEYASAVRSMGRSRVPTRSVA